MLAAMQKKNEVNSEKNGENRMVTVSTNWLPEKQIDRHTITGVNYLDSIFYRVLLPQVLA